MGSNPQSSVVNSYGQCHDIPNLFVCDASIFVTSGVGNPTNTVMSLALRTADYIKEQAKKASAIDRMFLHCAMQTNNIFVM